MLPDEEPLVSAIYSKVPRLKRIFQKLKSHSCDIEIVAREEGIHFISFPAHQVGLSHFFIAAEDCEVYDWKIDANITVETVTLHNMFRRIRQREDFALEFTLTSLRIVIVGEASRTFNLKIMESENKERALTLITQNAMKENPVKVVAPSSILGPITDILSFSEHLVIAAINSTIKVEGGNVSSVMPIQNIKTSVYGKYSSNLIHEQIPIAAVESQTVNFYLNENTTLKFETDFDTESYYECFIAHTFVETNELDGILDVPTLEDDDFIDIEI